MLSAANGSLLARYVHKSSSHSRVRPVDRPFISRRNHSAQVTFIRGTSTVSDWPSEYKDIFKPKTAQWPERSPLEVVDRDGNARRLSHVRGANSAPLLEKTMFETLEDATKLYGDNKALTVPYQKVSWTYQKLQEKVESLALGLLALGVEPGDRIGAWLPTMSEWITLQYATAKIGAILVCVNPAYRSSELVHSVNLVGLKGLFFQGQVKSSNYVDLLLDASPTLAKYKRTLDATKTRQAPFLLPEVLPEMPTLRFLVNVSTQSENIPDSFPTTLYDDILIPSTPESRREFDKLPPVLNTDPTNLQFTSGTTGSPKGTTLTHRNIVNNGFYIGERCGMKSTDILVAPTPMYHCFGCVVSNIASVTHGSHLVYPAPQFNAEATLKAVQDYKATMLHGVPTMFITERAVPNFDSFDLSTLRTGVMSGSTCPEATIRMVREDLHLSDITICYGMTEVSPICFQTFPSDPIWARVETVGKVQDHLQVKIVGMEEDGYPTLEVGDVGEICTKGYSVMKGYWGNDKATTDSIRDGWMHSGDLGYMDENGYLRVIGRRKDMIARGGEKVYPREIEDFLISHPDIQDVQIIGVPDQRLGEEIFAWIKMKKDREPLTLEALSNYCKNKVAHYKVPRYVQCLQPGEDYPMTVSGKVQKFLLRDQALDIMGLKKL